MGENEKRKQGMVADEEFHTLVERYASARSRAAAALGALGVRAVRPKTGCPAAPASVTRPRVSGRRVQLPQAT